MEIWSETAFAAAPICGHDRGPQLVVMRSPQRQNPLNFDSEVVSTGAQRHAPAVLASLIAAISEPLRGISSFVILDQINPAFPR